MTTQLKYLRLAWTELEAGSLLLMEQQPAQVAFEHIFRALHGLFLTEEKSQNDGPTLKAFLASDVMLKRACELIQVGPDAEVLLQSIRSWLVQSQWTDPAVSAPNEKLRAVVRAIERKLIKLELLLDQDLIRRRRRNRRIALAVIAVALVGWTGRKIWRAIEARSDAWIGEVFEEKSLVGERHVVSLPVLKLASRDDLSLYWGMPRDRFSMRWYSCVMVEQPTRIKASLTSDDGSRLFVGADLKIDHWGLHGMTTKEVELELPVGATLLRVEYFQEGYGAGLIVELKHMDGANVGHPVPLMRPVGTRPDVSCAVPIAQD